MNQDVAQTTQAADPQNDDRLSSLQKDGERFMPT